MGVLGDSDDVCIMPNKPHLQKESYLLLSSMANNYLESYQMLCRLLLGSFPLSPKAKLKAPRSE